MYMSTFFRLLTFLVYFLPRRQSYKLLIFVAIEARRLRLLDILLSV